MNQLENIVRTRRSIRNYIPQNLSKQEIQEINTLCNNTENPFGVDVKLYLLPLSEEAPQKLGTYGIIKGAKAYLGVSAPDVPYAYEAIGYVFEVLLLALTEKGLGTCWLGGTFDRDKFFKEMYIPQNHLFPIVSPVGYPSGKKHFLDKIVQKTAHSNQRKPWEEVFFRENGSPLEQNTPYAFPLEMLRLAPSARNLQTWRIQVNENTVHFFTCGESPMEKVNIGIALAHFLLAIDAEQKSGSITTSPEKTPTLENYHYSFSWTEHTR